MDKKDLKIEALRQRIAEITVQFEDKVADLRVEITVLAQEHEALKEKANVDVVSDDTDAPAAPATK